MPDRPGVSASLEASLELLRGLGGEPVPIEGETEVAAHFGARRDLAPRLVPSTNLAACQTMCVDGMGIAVLPAAMVAGDLAAGALAELDYDWTPAPLHFFARYGEERAPRYVAEAAGLAVAVAND